MTERYGSASGLRRALEARLMQEATDSGTDLAPRRRLIVFGRAAARLSADPGASWFLKGTAALEFRLCSRARATKDMNLAALPENDPDLDDRLIGDLLIDALARDEDGDGFLLQVSPAVPLRADTAGRGGWRLPIQSRLVGRIFATVRIDIVAHGEEISQTERLPLPDMLAFAGTPDGGIEAVDRRQHFAEKIHALTRDYGDRPNTRVKDLVDLVLFIESGLAADAAATEPVRHVSPYGRRTRSRRCFPTRPRHGPSPIPSWPQG